MNVLLLAENWPPRVGGIERYLSEIAAGLPAKSVTVIAPSAEINQQVFNRGQGIKHVIRKRFFWPLLKPAWLPVFFYVKKLVGQEKIDVILCGKALFEGLLAYHVKKSLGIPYIIFTYAMEIEVWAKKEPAKLRKVLVGADKVVYINDETKKSLLGLGVNESQLVKIWPGIDEGWFTAVAPDSLGAVLGKYALRQPYILTGSRLIERKGIDTVIEAFGKLDKTKFGNYTLAIFGTGPDEARLKSLASDKVKFLGHVPDEDMRAVYAGAEVFALTPREVAEDREGFGIVYLEAAAQGKAVIGSLSGGVPEAVVHNQTGILIQPDNPSALHEVLEKVLDDKNLQQSLGVAGKARAWDEFRWQKRMVLVKGMIDAVLDSRRLKNS